MKLKYYIFRFISMLFSFRYGQYLLSRIKWYLNLLGGFGYGGELKFSGELNVLSKIIKESTSESIIYDIGCNKGDFILYSYKFAKRFNKTLQYHAFEPNHYCYDFIKNKYNDYDNITFSQLAVSDSKNNKILYFDSKFSGSSSLIKPINDKNFDEMHVKTITLDDYCKTNIDLLKIDVEGHELSVIKSAKKLISENRIKNILFEFGGQGISSRTYFYDIYSFLIANNYNTYRITPSGYLFKINDWSYEYEYFSATNYIAILSI